MKNLLIIGLSMLLSTPGFTQSVSIVRDAHTTTIQGTGGWSEVKYSFKAGDQVHLSFASTKQMEMVMVIMHGNRELAKKIALKDGSLDFTMPETGEVVIRFVSDRRRVAEISYSITKIPGPQ